MQDLKEKIHKRWGVKTPPVTHDGSKYGAPDDEAWTRHDILGIRRVSEIKAAEKAGAIVYVAKDGCTRVKEHGSWRIRTEWFVDPTSGEKRRGVSRDYLEWREGGSKGPKTRRHEKSRKPDFGKDHHFT